MPETLTLENYRDAWSVGEMGGHFAKTAFIVLPALFLILFLSSAIAFACTRYSWRFNIFFLILFTAGNLMPQQVIFQPLFQIYKRVPIPDWLSDTDTGTLLGTKLGVILIHVAFQIGFCTFVLSNYMKTIPKELGEAATVDGASVPRQYFQVILPLCRPRLRHWRRSSSRGCTTTSSGAPCCSTRAVSDRSPRRSPCSTASTRRTTI